MMDEFRTVVRWIINNFHFKQIKDFNDFSDRGESDDEVKTAARLNSAFLIALAEDDEVRLDGRLAIFLQCKDACYLAERLTLFDTGVCGNESLRRSAVSYQAGDQGGRHIAGTDKDNVICHVV